MRDASGTRTETFSLCYYRVSRPSVRISVERALNGEFDPCGKELTADARVPKSALNIIRADGCTQTSRYRDVQSNVCHAPMWSFRSKRAVFNFLIFNETAKTVIIEHIAGAYVWGGGAEKTSAFVPSPKFQKIFFFEPCQDMSIFRRIRRTVHINPPKTDSVG